MVHRFNFKSPVLDLQFSPDDTFLAVTHRSKMTVYRASLGAGRAVAPLQRHRTYTGHYDDVTCLDWSPNGKYIVTGSRDQTARVYSTWPTPGFVPVTLGGHRDMVTGVFFVEDDTIFTTSRDAAVFRWEWEEAEGVEVAGQALRTIQREGGQGDSDAGSSDTSSDSDSDSDTSLESSREDSDSDSAIVPGSAAAPTGQGARAPAFRASRDRHTVPAPWDEEEPGAEGDLSILRGSWSLVSKKYFKMQGAKLVSSVVHRRSGLLVAGFSTGVFGVYTLPDVTPVHTLSISQRLVTSAAINPSGDWLAFGCADLGQLLVWEWKSESYILKQQGHFYDVSAVAYSPDGQVIATGGDDGKVKLWSAASGFCFVTFDEHTAPVTAVTFIGGTGGRGQAVLSASRDGTVKAFDLVRYRNFRTLVAPESLQFTCLTADATGDIVAAGTQDPFSVYVWNLQTGKLLDVLAGHDGPISDIALSHTTGQLATSSWDGTARVWDVFSPGTSPEVFSHPSDVLAVAWRPDGKELATASREGGIHFWDTATGKTSGVINGKRDIRGGRRKGAAAAVLNSGEGKCFTSLAYTGDGECLLAGGRSKWLCLYAVAPKLLLRKFQLSHNRDLDGLLAQLNSKDLTESGIAVADVEGAVAAGASALMPQASVHSDELRIERYLPGAQRGEAASSRRTPPELRTRCVRFAPGGRAFAVATTIGLLQFGVDASLTFDPFELDEDVTPDAVAAALRQGHWTRALVMALHLNLPHLIKETVDAVPAADIAIVARAVPAVFLVRLLEHVGAALARTRALEYHTTWATCLMTAHGSHLRSRDPAVMSALRSVLKALQFHTRRMGGVGTRNTHMLQFVSRWHGVPQEGDSAAVPLVTASLLPALAGTTVPPALLGASAAVSAGGGATGSASAVAGLDFNEDGDFVAKAGSGDEAASDTEASDVERHLDGDSASQGSASDTDVAGSDGVEEQDAAAQSGSGSDSSSSAATSDDEEEEEPVRVYPGRAGAFVEDEASEGEEEDGVSTEGSHSDDSGGGELRPGEWREGGEEDGEDSQESEDDSFIKGSSSEDSVSDHSDSEGAKQGAAARPVVSSDSESEAEPAASAEDTASPSSEWEGVDLEADAERVFQGGDWATPAAANRKQPRTRRAKRFSKGTASGSGDAVLDSAVSFFSAPMQMASPQLEDGKAARGTKRSRKAATPPAAKRSARGGDSPAPAPAPVTRRRTRSMSASSQDEAATPSIAPRGAKKTPKKAGDSAPPTPLRRSARRKSRA